MKTLLRHFALNERGNVYMLTAMTTPVAAFLAIGAMEYQKASNLKHKAQYVADSAAIYASSEGLLAFEDMQDEQKVAQAQAKLVDFFEDHFANEIAKGTVRNLTVDYSVDASKTHRLDANFAVDYTVPGFMNWLDGGSYSKKSGGSEAKEGGVPGETITQKNYWSLGVSSGAIAPDPGSAPVYGLTGDLEVAFVIDISGSMGWPTGNTTKIAALRDALGTALDKLEQSENESKALALAEGDPSLEHSVTVSIFPFDDRIAFNGEAVVDWTNDFSSEPEEMIRNGSFEDIDGGLNWNSWTVKDEDDVPHWDVLNGNWIEVWNNGFLGVQPTDGNNVVEVDAGMEDNSPNDADAFLRQRMKEDTVNGATYTVTFDYTARPGHIDSSKLIVAYDGQEIGRVVPTDANWHTYTFTFTGNGDNDRIEFRLFEDDTDTLGGLLDNVSVMGPPDLPAELCLEPRGVGFDDTLRTPDEKWFDTTTDGNCRNNEWVMPPNNDWDAMADYVAKLDDNNGTDTDLGVRWGYRALSHEWADWWMDFDGLNIVEDASVGDDNYQTVNVKVPANPATKDVSKVMVIMTDGDNNHTESDDLTEDLCDNAKADGILIMTIAFEAPDRGTNLMQYCASDRANAIDNGDPEQMKYFFDSLNLANFQSDFEGAVNEIINGVSGENGGGSGTKARIAY